MQALVIMCGSSVHDDQASGVVHATGAMEDFAERRLFMGSNELLGHAKTHS